MENTFKHHPAFPLAYDEVNDVINEGLTKREYFAAMAMQGILMTQDGPLLWPHQLAKKAVEQANALIKALNEEE